MRIELRPRTALALLLVVLIGLTGGSAVVGAFDDADRSDAGPNVETHTLEDGSELWPYTSRTTSVEERTLPINLVVYGDADLTEAMFRQSVVTDWEDVEDDEQDLAPAEDVEPQANQTTIAWGGADGATRFVYVETPGGDGYWMDESYQLREGDYLGGRDHVRAYEDPANRNWTAMQAHREHWDWFHLRHTVHSVEESQSYVEDEFVDRVYVEDLYRDRYGNSVGSDANGWVTVIRLDERYSAALGLLVALGSVGSVGLAGAREWLTEARTDQTVRHGAQALLVVASIVGFYTAIRYGAIGVERTAPNVNPKVVIAGFYPVLVCGMPVVAYLTARRLETIQAFAAATVGFAVAILFDYTYLGVTALPIETVVHRLALAIAIGFVAAGASASARDPDVTSGHVRTGVLLWLAAVAVPLLQFL